MFKETMVLITEVLKCDLKNEKFPSLNVINGKSSLYGSKGILIHCHYWSDPKFGMGIVAIRIIT